MTAEELTFYRYYRNACLSILREWRKGYRANCGNARQALCDLRTMKATHF